jgi:hypothetical protein
MIRSNWLRKELVLVALATGCVAAQATEPAPPAGASPPPAEGHGPPHGGPELPDHFTNLKVLPKDISKKDLLAVMREMNGGLGVRCNYCHVTEPKKDWAADTDHKDNARGMLRLTNRINAEIFTWPKAPRATCYMCHHGEEKPQTVAPLPPGGPHPPGGPPGGPHPPPEGPGGPPPEPPAAH